ncbi:MAG TPA: HAD-IA family hydrolase [Acidimicrobiales bacterium]|nr:HAD-IA family hydrolase [Acidimicrobiales bacterium]
MHRFDAVLFDNGGTLFHKPAAPPVIVALAATLGRTLDDEEGVAAWGAVKAAKRAITDQALVFSRNRSAEGHRRYYTTCYAPLDEIADGLADAFYRALKTSPESMIPYPDTTAVLARLHEAGVPVGVVSNTDWNIRQGYERSGLDRFISTYVLSFEHGTAKPEPEMWRLACAELDVDPAGVLMVGNNAYADTGIVAIGGTALILPPVERGERRGLSAVLGLAGIDEPAAVPAA